MPCLIFLMHSSTGHYLSKPFSYLIFLNFTEKVVPAVNLNAQADDQLGYLPHVHITYNADFNFPSLSPVF